MRSTSLRPEDDSQCTAPVIRIFDHEALSLNPIELADLSAILPARLPSGGWTPRAPERERRALLTTRSAACLRCECPRTLSGLSVQVLCGGRPAARGAARGRADAVRRGRAASSYTSCFSASSRRGIARGDGTITVERMDEARALFEEVAVPMLSRLSDAEAALERARLFGSAASHGHRRCRARARSVAAGRGARAVARVPARGRLLARSARRTAGGAQRRGRSRRSAGRQPHSRHRLQIGASAESETRASGGGVRAMRPGASRGAWSRIVDGGRGGLRGVLGETDAGPGRSCRRIRRRTLY